MVSRRVGRAPSMVAEKRRPLPVWIFLIKPTLFVSARSQCKPKGRETLVATQQAVASSDTPVHDWTDGGTTWRERVPAVPFSDNCEITGATLVLEPTS